MLLGGKLETGDHAERGGLAAPRWAQQREELPVGDGEVELLDRHHLAEPLDDSVELDRLLGQPHLSAQVWGG